MRILELRRGEDGFLRIRRHLEAVRQKIALPDRQGWR
jgi:hypothetical protein